MTDKDIEKIAQRVAQVLYERAHADLSFMPPDEDEEQILLAELAKLMTLLSSYLEQEQYQINYDKTNARIQSRQKTCRLVRESVYATKA